MKKIYIALAAFLVAALLYSGIVPISPAFAAAAQKQMPEAWNLNEKVHPDLKDAFSRLPPIIDDVRDVKTLRDKLSPNLEALPTDAAVAVRNEMIPGDDQTPDLRVRIYEPKEREGALPALLWIHGGGYLLGSPESDEGLLLQIAKELQCVVVAPDYRLAPEHRFPAAVDDCYRALRWMTNGQSSLTIKTDRVAVAGGSAGGGLTAAVTLRARDEKGPEICFAMPLYPMLDNRNATTSSYQITDARVWNRDAGEAAWALYFGEDFRGDISPYAAPARAKNLSDLPPMYIMVGALDMFRDEIIEYAERLLDAGVPVELHIYPGAFHAFESMVPDAKVSQDARSAYIKALGQALNR